MGEMADYFIEQMMDQQPNPDYDYGDYEPKPTPLRCKYCNSEKVYWKDTIHSGWRLYDMGKNKPHKCKKVLDK